MNPEQRTRQFKELTFLDASQRIFMDDLNLGELLMFTKYCVSYYKKSSLFFLGFLALSFMLSSCSSIERSHNNRGIEISISSPMQAQIDVDLSNELVGYAYGGYLFNFLKVAGDTRYAPGMDYPGGGKGLLNLFSRVDKVKAAAAYNAVRQSNADVLISPQYVVEETHWNPFWKSVKVKVTGYAGKVVAIRNAN